MNNESYAGTASGFSGPLRLDRYAAEYLKLLTRSQIKSRSMEAAVNGRKVKLSHPVKAGDLLELSWLPAAEENLEPENIPLDILYEDDRVAVVNKRAGMVVHPGAGHRTGTLAGALLWRRLYRRSGAAREAFSPRTGIVHRLDKDTSGVIIAAYDDEALAFLAAQFKARTVRKQYAALVAGIPAERSGMMDGTIVRDPADRKRFTVFTKETRGVRRVNSGPAGGKPALTNYRVLRSWGNYSLLLLRPKTGRTHQIRVHLKDLGHPILGDPVYGFPDRSIPDASLALHAYSLAIVLPGHTEVSRFKAPPPENFKALMALLRKRYGS